MVDLILHRYLIKNIQHGSWEGQCRKYSLVNSVYGSVNIATASNFKA